MPLLWARSRCGHGPRAGTVHVRAQSTSAGGKGRGTVWWWTACPRPARKLSRRTSVTPSRGYREEFVIVPGGPIYLDGNSLGRQPRAARAAIAALMDEWGRDLVSGWDRWMDLPGAVGDRIGALVGAGPGQVVLSDSTTVNLHKLALAAVGSMAGRRVIVGDANDFPTVRYVLQGIAAREDRDLKLLATDPVEGVGPAAIADAVSEDVALVCLSGVNYRSGALVDLAEVTGAAHRAGAMVLWDLSHAAGAVPVEPRCNGCRPGGRLQLQVPQRWARAPAWLYVRSDLQERLRQPIWGWWGQRDQFAMGPSYDPVPGMYRFLAGTPAVLGMVAVDAGVAPLLSAGMPALWAKARQLVALLSQRAEELLVPLGARIASPADAQRRGGHLALSHRTRRARPAFSSSAAWLCPTSGHPTCCASPRWPSTPVSQTCGTRRSGSPGCSPTPLSTPQSPGSGSPRDWRSRPVRGQLPASRAQQIGCRLGRRPSRRPGWALAQGTVTPWRTTPPALAGAVGSSSVRTFTVLGGMVSST